MLLSDFLQLLTPGQGSSIVVREHPLHVAVNEVDFARMHVCFESLTTGQVASTEDLGPDLWMQQLVEP